MRIGFFREYKILFLEALLVFEIAYDNFGPDPVLLTETDAEGGIVALGNIQQNFLQVVRWFLCRQMHRVYSLSAQAAFLHGIAESFFIYTQKGIRIHALKFGF